MADRVPQDVPATGAIAGTRPIHGIAQRLTHSFAVYGITNFGIRALNFLLIVIYAHYLRPDDYGVIYIAEIIASFLVIFAGLSIDSALQRLYFRHSQHSEELRGYLGSTFLFGFSWMMLVLVLALVLGRYLQSQFLRYASVPFYPYVATAIATAIASQAVQFRLALYQVSRLARSYASLSITLAILTAICCLYEIVIRQAGAIGMMKGKLVAAAITSVIAVWSIRSILTTRFQWRFVRESLSFSVPLIPHLVMASGLVVADRFILEHYRGLSEVGIYSLAYTFGMIMFLVTQSLSQAWLPMFFELAGDGEGNKEALGRICSGLAMFLVALACLGILLSPLFIQAFLDYRYQVAARIVPLVVMGYLFHALFSLFDLSILQAKRTAIVFLISLIAFTVNLVLNFAMIPRWGMYGAAWATTIAYGVEAVGAYLLAQRVFALPYRVPQLLAAIAVSGGALWLTQSSSTSKWRGLLVILSLVGAFGLLVLIGKRDLRNTLMAVRNSRKHQAKGTL